jgi:hypothetical protein
MNPSLHRLALLVALTACGGTTPVELIEPLGEVIQPAKTTLAPPPGPFNGSVKVTLATAVPADIFVTLDGSDPSVASPERVTGSSTLELELTQSTTLKFFSRTDAGAAEAVRTATYTRAGGPVGSIEGAVVVGTIAVGKKLGLFVDAKLHELPTPDVAKDVPFFIADLSTGQHRLMALSDRDGDGQLWPFLD